VTGATTCAACAAIDGDVDALQTKTVEIVETFHNPCAPVVQYTCRCRTCAAVWHVVEVFDEDGVRPSEWSWQKAATT
jgi:hypothetical protein